MIGRIVNLRHSNDEFLGDEFHRTVSAALNRRRAMIRPDDVDDLRSQVAVRILKRLASGEPIESFYDYVAVVTYHVVDDYVRARDPQRAFISNRLKYVLTRNPVFAIWSNGVELVCGLAAWRGTSASPLDISAAVNADRMDESLSLLFREVGRAVSFQSVVTLFARSRAPLVEEPRGEDVSAQVETRELLARLWIEIKDLPLRQRVALLLNLRDSGLPQFVLSGIATFETLAAALGWNVDELTDAWSELPFDDARIARQMGVTTQQVINLRKSARARLQRRMTKW